MKKIKIKLSLSNKYTHSIFKYLVYTITIVYQISDTNISEFKKKKKQYSNL